MQQTEKPRFVLKIGEIFASPVEGLKAVQEALKKSRKARLSNLPDGLLAKLYPRIAHHQVKEVFLHDEGQAKGLADIGAAVKPLTSHWYQNFLGERLNHAEVLTPTALFQVLWVGDKVKRVFAHTDPKCIECSWKKNFMMRLEGEHRFCTVFDRKQGLDDIAQRAARAAVVRACIIPPPLLQKILPAMLKTDYRLILSRRDPILPHFKKNPDVRMGSDAKIFVVYGGEEATVGSLRLDHEMYSIFWRGESVFSVLKFDNLVCSNCITRVFDTAWKYSRTNAA